MAQKASVDIQQFLVGGAIIAYLTNSASAFWWHYPFLYCWLNVPVGVLFLTWGYAIGYILLGFMIWYFLRGQQMRAFGAILLAVGLFELPRLFDMVFRLGGSCGT